MTLEEYNNLALKANDNVQITMIDGQVYNVFLYSGEAYLGRGEYQNYLTKEIIPANPVKILINGDNPNDFVKFIHLDDVLKVDLLEYRL